MPAPMHPPPTLLPTRLEWWVTVGTWRTLQWPTSFEYGEEQYVAVLPKPPSLVVETQCLPIPTTVAVNVWKHATHHPTSGQCTHPAHKLTKWHAHPWPPAHAAWPTSTPYAVCVCSTVCGQCLWDPLCLLRWFTPHSKQCHPLGCIAGRHQGSSAGMGKPVHPRAHTSSCTWSGP